MGAKKISGNFTPPEAAKIIGSRLIKSGTPLELLIAGRCFKLAGGVIASVSTEGILFRLLYILHDYN